MADDDSHFEPTDGASNEAEDDNDDEGGEIDSNVLAYSYDSDLDNNPLALPEEGRHGAHKATEESRRSA